MKQTTIFTILLTALSLFAAAPAPAETAPGDACTSGQANLTRLTGGAETAGTVHLLRCACAPFPSR
jgi:hypothetical protein